MVIVHKVVAHPGPEYCAAITESPLRAFIVMRVVSVINSTNVKVQY